MKLLRQTYLLLRKDLVLELRRRESLLTMFFFGTLLLFVFHFSFDLVPEKVTEMAPALLWLAFLFTGTLGLTQLFEAERTNHCLDALLLSPMDRAARQEILSSTTRGAVQSEPIRARFARAGSGGQGDGARRRILNRTRARDR